MFGITEISVGILTLTNDGNELNVENDSLFGLVVEGVSSNDWGVDAGGNAYCDPGGVELADKAILVLMPGGGVGLVRANPNPT